MEKMLTVLVPIHGDEDFVIVSSQVPSVSNTEQNKVYLYNDAYYRRYGDTVVAVTDVEFPRIGYPLELFDFTYSATRMSTAPTITASTKWYAEKDEDDNLFYNLEDKWTSECHVEFDGQKYYLKDIPTSSKDNEDARFKYEMEFVSHWSCLEKVFIYDTVAPYIAERQLNESETFSFYGDINELRKRINAALVRSGLSSYRKIPDAIDYLSYQQWNDIPLGIQSDPYGYYQTYQGDYTAYLQDKVFEYEDGEFVIDGYQVVIDDGVTSDERLITFDKNSIYDALQKICDKDSGFGLSYYYKHGTKEIHIGDSEYDFGEENAVSYGRYKELLSIKKTNNTEKVINRMTGKGSDENIPYYYPNPTADGWLKSVYNRVLGSGSTPTVTDAQPSDVYPSSAANAYEKFLKNRLGHKFEFGGVIAHIHEIGYRPDISRIEVAGEYSYQENKVVTHYYFLADKRNVVKNPYIESRQTRTSEGETITPYLDFVFNMSKLSETGESLQLKAMLRDVTTDTVVGVYDSFNYDESTASDFAKMCHSNDHSVVISLTQYHTYDLSVNVYLDEVPLAEDYTYEGFHYESHIDGLEIQNPDHYTVYDEDFYVEQGLKNKGSVITVGTVPAGTYTLPSYTQYYLCRRCEDDSSVETIVATSVNAIEKQKGMLYKDLSSGVIYECIREEMYRPDAPYNGYAFRANPKISLDEWISHYLSLDIRIYNPDGWYQNGKKVNLSDYGLTVSGNPVLFDTITFKRLKYLTPQKNLMPELYIKTDGERRFYNAINYPYAGSTADTATGEYVDGSNVENDLYKDDNDEYIDFENPYTPQLVSEDIRNYEDIKPSIKGMTNTVDGNTFRIDVAEEYAYDLLDDDSVWETENDGNIEGDYKHPHFFIKLRQMPFNLFDLALQEDMEISLTSGSCGSCKFKIKVDENTKKNPVQVWTEDVYIKPYLSGEDEYELYATAGTLQRYTTKKLYKKERKSYIDDSDPQVPVSVFYYEYSEIDMHWDSMYTADAVINGTVGSLNTENHSYMEGDVVTRGVFQAAQQDTSTGEVWLALEKDSDTFGMLMPAARPTYNDETFSIYIRPKSVADTEDEDTADTFVITNIKMPQYYLRFAEHQLSKAIIKDLGENNSQKFNFSMNFSRIFLAENKDFLENLTENAVLYAAYNNKSYKQYIKSFTYKMSSNEALPDITVDMNDELSVVYGGFTERVIGAMTDVVTRDITTQVRTTVDMDLKRRYVSKNGTAVVSGNVVSRRSDLSMVEENLTSARHTVQISSNMETLGVNDTKIRAVDTKSDTKASIAGVVNDLSIIRNTLEYRFASDSTCGGNLTEKTIQNGLVNEYYWLSASGVVYTHSDSVCREDLWIYGKNE